MVGGAGPGASLKCPAGRHPASSTYNSGASQGSRCPTPSIMRELQQGCARLDVVDETLRDHPVVGTQSSNVGAMIESSASRVLASSTVSARRTEMAASTAPSTRHGRTRRPRPPLPRGQQLGDIRDTSVPRRGSRSATRRRHASAFRRRPAPTRTSATGRATRRPTLQAPGNGGGSGRPGRGADVSTRRSTRSGTRPANRPPTRPPIECPCTTMRSIPSAIVKSSRNWAPATAPPAATADRAAPSRPRQVGCDHQPLPRERADHVHPRPGAGRPSGGRADGSDCCPRHRPAGSERGYHRCR